LTKPADVKQLVETIKKKFDRSLRTAPLQIKRVSTILRENADEIVGDWLREASRNETLSSVQLSKEQRVDHVRQIIEELARRIEAGPNVIADRRMEGAMKHGQERYEQGYTVQRIAIEARLLHSVVSGLLYKHLLSVDMSTCISDMMQMGESLHEQFEESIRAFEEQSRQSQTA
jgi:flagellar motor switch protein FliG